MPPTGASTRKKAKERAAEAGGRDGGRTKANEEAPPALIGGGLWPPAAAGAAGDRRKVVTKEKQPQRQLQHKKGKTEKGSTCGSYRQKRKSKRRKAPLALKAPAPGFRAATLASPGTG